MSERDDAEWTAAQWGRAPQVGNAPNTEAQTVHSRSNNKILHNTRKQTDLYSGLPYTDSTGQST